ncbi:MAG: GGDEF domain-containing protein [Gallionella sp.]|nr:GGDEF domain-containing protein [Gallionella sp.]MDD4945699.1 GGDEF domain-containing protein [Gallionella sp.]MDD5611819.1 GGDEF domain-containing protein [Gallionella sp.]
MNNQNPTELARETFKTLVQRKLSPTPDNYSAVYAEISGTPSASNEDAEQVLRKIAEHLQKSDKAAATGNTLKKIISEENWAQCYPEIEKILPRIQSENEQAQSWPVLIRDLLRQLEVPHKGLTITRKKEGLETVLTRFGSKPEILYEKIGSLVRSWSGSPVTESLIEPGTISAAAAPDSPATPTPGNLPATAAVTNPTAAPAIAPHTHSPESAAEMLSKLSELLAQTLESTISAQPEMAHEVAILTAQVRSIQNHDQVTTLAKQLRQFWLKVELRGGDKVKIQEGLVRLLRLLVENVGEMVESEEWLHGQIVTLHAIIDNPIDRHVIADAERSLRDAIIKQGLLSKSLSDAKTTLKSLMTTFIDRLGSITESTGDYHQKIEGYSRQIAQSNNLSELNSLLDAIMQDTRIVQADTLRTHEQLVDSRKQVNEAELKIQRLEKELSEVSELVHQDQLTGTLNRRGLDDAFERETKRTERNHSPMCVALLDIDNFKRLNDTLGHQVGDQALIHLSTVIKEALRPTDCVARYGGEEFVILLPDVELTEAASTIERLQRELTKQFFMHENDRILVTFSAGVAQRMSDEPQDEVVGRADKAMYQAKRSGKNRVVVAENF